MQSDSVIAAPFVNPDKALTASLTEQLWLVSFNSDLEAQFQLVPLSSVAVNPNSDADMVDLIANKVPKRMLSELIRVAAWRSMGQEDQP